MRTIGAPCVSLLCTRFEILMCIFASCGDNKQLPTRLSSQGRYIRLLLGSKRIGNFNKREVSVYLMTQASVYHMCVPCAPAPQNPVWDVKNGHSPFLHYNSLYTSRHERDILYLPAYYCTIYLHTRPAGPQIIVG